MFYTTKLYITHTYIDKEVLNARVFHTLSDDTYTIDTITQTPLEESDTRYKQGIRTSIVLTPYFEKKEELQSFLIEIYTKHTEKTYLFLGDIHTYSTALQESLLKLIEEPPQNIQIILYSQSTNTILPTILSRSQTTSLPQALIFECIDSQLAEKVKKKLPSPQTFIKDFIAQNSTAKNSIDVKKCEREEIDMWLWQLLMYTKQVYLSQKGSRLIARKIETLIHALDLNERNVQKKFVIESLFV